MLPPGGTSPAVKFVAEGRRHAAIDLLSRLREIEVADPIYGVFGDAVDEEIFATLGLCTIPLDTHPFHFGHALVEIIEKQDLSSLAYFGGGSAPLISTDFLDGAYKKASGASSPYAYVNNYHSTDWMILNDTKHIPELRERIPTDNSLGWVLAHEGGIEVEAASPQAMTRLDIDTPLDLLMIKRHPNLGNALGTYLEDAPVEALARVDAIRDILRTPASSIALIGRVPSYAWVELERRTQIWCRVFSEERGMISSQRMAHGEVQSFIGQMLVELGPEEFVARLASMVDGAFWDTRVWMAATGLWPPDEVRFALDLGWVDQIQDEEIRALAIEVANAPIPILSGGYSTVSGGLCALLESI
jgi:hypothetical protein